MRTPNLGWKFYKEYFTDVIRFSDSDYAKRDKDETQIFIAGKHKEFLEKQVYVESGFDLFLGDGLQAIELKTIYPGLATGIGTKHETGYRGEWKLGFAFDYTSGMPYLPGHSVKGVLRSAFNEKSQWSGVLIELIQEALPGRGDINQTWLEVFREEVFDGKRSKKEISIYERDLFFDAVVSKPCQSEKLRGRILGEDFITPHIIKGMTYEESMLRNPLPIPFIKVLSDVTFAFYFKLHDSSEKLNISKEQKLKIFKKILMTFGAGAKTNVGYGQFEEVATNESSERKSASKETQHADKPELNDPTPEAKEKINNKPDWNGKIIDATKKGKFIIEIEVDGEKVRLKKEGDKFKGEIVPRIGANVSIKFTAKYSNLTQSAPAFNATVMND